MDIEYINPFIEASKSVLLQMGGIEANLGKVVLKQNPYTSESVIIIVGLTGKIRGQVVFSMTKTVAIFIASSMMGGFQLTDLDEIGKSAISELTNMILGNTATILYNQGIGIEITPPSFIMGDNLQISNRMKTITVPLLFNQGGRLDIDISVVE